jgi:hypothetical protein
MTTVLDTDNSHEFLFQTHVFGNWISPSSRAHRRWNTSISHIPAPRHVTNTTNMEINNTFSAYCVLTSTLRLKSITSRTEVSIYHLPYTVRAATNVLIKFYVFFSSVFLSLFIPSGIPLSYILLLFTFFVITYSD